MPEVLPQRFMNIRNKNIQQNLTELQSSSRICLNTLASQHAYDSQVPPFISNEDSYVFCACGNSSSCQCGKPHLTKSSFGFLAWCVHHVQNEVAFTIEPDGYGNIKVGSHVVGSPMSAPSIKISKFPGAGHSHPLVAYCMQHCYIGWASAEDLCYYLISQGQGVWGVIPSLEGVYYYRPTVAPHGTNLNSIRSALMRIASVWHTHRSTDATPDDSQFRWCPVEYLHHMANLTWTRVCSGECEPSHGPVCTQVPTCNIEGDYPIFQVFFEPHHLRYEDNIVNGLDLHSVLSSSNVHSWCQYRDMMPQVVAPSRMLIVAGMQSDASHGFGNVGQCHRSVLFNKFYGQPVAPVKEMSKKQYMAFRKASLMFAREKSRDAVWEDIARAIGQADFNRRVDLYNMHHGEGQLSDDEVRRRLHLNAWFFNEWDMEPCKLDGCKMQKVILLSDSSHLERFKILRKILSKLTSGYVELHELPPDAAARLGLAGMCRPDDIHWNVINPECVIGNPGDKWHSICRSKCAGQNIYIAWAPLEQMKKVLYHEIAHLFHDILWKPEGNHDKEFYEREKGVLKLAMVG